MTILRGLHFLKDVRDGRTWIVLFFLVRLLHITQPPLEVVHNWRQCTVAMVARNFDEVDNNILYPRLDIGGSGTGIEGMEFPVLNYSIYLVSEIFGYEHWYGRLINLIVSSLGVWFFFLLVRRFWNERIAWFGVIILECSLWFLYMRKIMPDTFSVSLVIAGIYYGCRFLLDKKSWLHLGAYMVLTGLGVLAKLPAGCLFPALLIPLLKAERKQQGLFLAATGIWLSCVGWWYFIWVPYLNTMFGTGHFFMGNGILQGTQELLTNWPLLLGFFYDHTLKYIGFVVFLGGLIYAALQREKVLLSIFALAFAALLVVLAKGGSSVLHHDYYMVPFAPVMALIAAYGLHHIRKHWLSLTLLAGIVLEGLLNQVHDFRIKEKDARMLTLERVLDGIGDVNNRIAINSGKYPTPMYFAHRKGWLCTNAELSDAAYVHTMTAEGLTHIVILKELYEGDCVLPYSLVYEDPVMKIYSP